MLSDSSARCHGLTCDYRLWHLLYAWSVIEAFVILNQNMKKENLHTPKYSTVYFGVFFFLHILLILRGRETFDISCIESSTGIVLIRAQRQFVYYARRLNVKFNLCDWPYLYTINHLI